ncbi:MAG: tetratricopeptide repeat protein, partial [Flavipsychrobacter sp.]
MRSVSYIFLVLIGITVFGSCKGNKGSASNSPALIATPELKNITEKINDNPKDASLYFQRGIILHRLQEDTLALNDFKQATKLDSTKAEYFSAVGDLMFEHKDVTGSVKWLQKALDLNPGDKKAQLKVAKMFVYIKEYSSAFKAINTVLRQDVYNPEAYFLKGMIYKDLKDTAKAISSFQTAVQVAPDYKEAVLQLGSIYS